MKKVVVFGPGPRFKGGIANYNTSLAKAFDKAGVEVHIVSWTQQYPAIIPRDFIDRKSRKDQLEGTGIKVHYITNYNKPGTWAKTSRLIREIAPDVAIFQWSISIQGLPLGRIIKRLKNYGVPTVIDMHFVVQKENSNIDRKFKKMGVKRADMYVVHAMKTADELKQLFPERSFEIIMPGQKPTNDSTRVLKLYHPVYDMFKPDPQFDVEKAKQEMKLRKNVFLFFGFIRKYKGLHNVIKAFKVVADKRDDVSLVIVGESFWNTLDKKKFSTRLKSATFGVAKKIFLSKQDDEKNYRPIDLVKELQLEDSVYVFNDFVPNEDVHKYFQVSDNLMLYYLTATPSGVESIGYNFRMPMLATRVGHFPETVKDGFNGYLAEPNDIESMAGAMIKAIEQPIPRENVAATSAEMSWTNYAAEIMRVAGRR
ncbi:MAG: glycosyltransferase [Bacteroidetes bacterium]|nr:glycosyltransferase [Bacteroidota bacterium]MBU1717740.1 glycosyltransferase [Bacteroidota bacterium]